MEQAKHTPGPWAVHRSSDRDYAWIVPADHVARHIGGSSNMQVDRDQYAQQICTLNHDAHGRRAVMDDARRIVQCANSHDELVAALEGLMELERRDRFMPTGREWDAARAAIAKATALSA